MTQRQNAQQFLKQRLEVSDEAHVTQVERSYRALLKEVHDLTSTSVEMDETQFHFIKNTLLIQAAMDSAAMHTEHQRRETLRDDHRHAEQRARNLCVLQIATYINSCYR